MPGMPAPKSESRNNALTLSRSFWGRRYGLADRMPEEAAWAHKYIMILDGNTFSSRLMRTLRSGSLIFRAGLFTEWFDERLEPFVHYLPVRQQL